MSLYVSVTNFIATYLHPTVVFVVPVVFVVLSHYNSLSFLKTTTLFFLKNNIYNLYNNYNLRMSLNFITTYLNPTIDFL